MTPVPLPGGCEGGKEPGKEPRSQERIHSPPLEQVGWDLGCRAWMRPQGPQHPHKGWRWAPWRSVGAGAGSVGAALLGG